MEGYNKMQRKQPIENDGIKLWRCPTCKRWLPKSSFYPDKRTWNKIKSQCRNCHIKSSIKTRNKDNKNKLNRESMRKARINNLEKFREREKIAARKRPKDIRYYSRQCLNNAVNGGIIVKPSKCEKCGKEKKLTAHHEDYTKPLNVEWLCYECHGNR